MIFFYNFREEVYAVIYIVKNGPSLQNVFSPIVVSPPGGLNTSVQLVTPGLANKYTVYSQSTDTLLRSVLSLEVHHFFTC